MRLDGHDPAAIESAAERLGAGELVAFATETVYGLGARADDDAAVDKIFAAKGRPRGHPLIVHVVDRAAAVPFAARIPPSAARLMDEFWPGPLTVIVPRASGMATAAAGGHATLALPRHAPGRPRFAVAAQRHGVASSPRRRESLCRVSPTLARIRDSSRRPLLLDAVLPSAQSSSSTLVRGRCCCGGRLDAARIEPLGSRSPWPTTWRSRRRNRPSTTLRARSPPDGHVDLPTACDAGVIRGLAYIPDVPAGTASGLLHVAAARPEQAAHELFSVLRELDDEGVQLIWVEEPPPGPDWDGVRDRLTRAAAT